MMVTKYVKQSSFRGEKVAIFWYYSKCNNFIWNYEIKSMTCRILEAYLCNLVQNVSDFCILLITCKEKPYTVEDITCCGELDNVLLLAICNYTKIHAWIPYLASIVLIFSQYTIITICL